MLGWLIGAVSNISYLPHYSTIDSSKVSLPKSLASLAELLPHLEKKTFENHQIFVLGRPMVQDLFFFFFSVDCNIQRGGMDIRKSFLPLTTWLMQKTDGFSTNSVHY